MLLHDVNLNYFKLLFVKPIILFSLSTTFQKLYIIYECKGYDSIEGINYRVSHEQPTNSMGSVRRRETNIQHKNIITFPGYSNTKKNYPNRNMVFTRNNTKLKNNSC